MNVGRLAAIALLSLATAVCGNRPGWASGGQGIGTKISRHHFHIEPHLRARSNVLAEFFRGATVESVRPFLDEEELLQLAARYTDNADIITFLIDSGFDPNAAFGYGIPEYLQDWGPKLREGPLHYAAAYNPVPGVVEALVKGGADANALGGTMLETPLHRAAVYNNAAVVAALIKGGADPNAVNGRISTTWSRSANINGNTPLHRAVCNEDASVIDALVGAGAHVTSRNASGFLPLHFAVLCKRVGSIMALKRHRADVGAAVTLVRREDEMHDCTGCNVVHLFLNSLIDDGVGDDGIGKDSYDLAGSRDFLTAVVDAGASVNAEVADGMYAGYSPLQLAVEADLGLDMVALLMDLGAEAKSDLLHALLATEFQYTGKYAGGNRMRSLSSAGNLEVLDQILGHEEVDVDVRDHCGRTPLHRAASLAYYRVGARGTEKVIETLIAAGADVNTQLGVDEDAPEECWEAQFTPLHEAVRWGGESDSGYAIASMLLAAGADANVRNPAGESAFDVAANDRMKALLAHAELHRHDVPTERPKADETAEREEGAYYVSVEFVVTETGAVRDPVVIEAEPQGLFERHAIDAALKLRFKPKMVDGRPVAVSGVRRTFRFEPEGELSPFDESNLRNPDAYQKRAQ